MSSEPADVTVIVDVANVMGCRPDGWWRDRAKAAGNILRALVDLIDHEVTIAALGPVRFQKISAVVEGKACAVADAPPVRVVRAEGIGDDTIAYMAKEATGQVVVVTSDQGLRQRCLLSAAVVSSGSFRKLLDLPNNPPAAPDPEPAWEAGDWPE